MRFLFIWWISLPIYLFSQSIELLCKKFDSLNTLIRDQKIDTAIAKNIFRNLITSIKEQTKHLPYASEWIFPIQGYSPKYIGGRNGEGYIPQDYDYFTGNNHKAHPAHDIFIYDLNQDCLDDVKKQYVNVLSITEGVVVACAKEWDTTSTLRGGIYVWIYSPSEEALFYYAHLNTIQVDIGTVVHSGKVLGTVGRTGLNAYKKRSPTHLHLSMLSVKDNLPVPQNPYAKLCRAKCVP
ncbi:MAG: M23 family metallopeptidase [Bacteroidia bacterium]|nr:M23 family metallopeptidase [Bacteroidia bacterium]MDW8347394.1 M23 family metallopeptidase [Bacteroidia bacterium]